MITNRENKYNGYFKIDKIEHKTKSGSIAQKEVMMKRDAVAAIVFDTIKNKFIFVSQWRPGPQSDLVEAVAGTLEQGEDPKDTMIREIDEEIGYKVDSIKKIGCYYMSPGCVSEKIYMYYCEVSEKIHEGGGLKEENEEIDIIEMDINEMIEYQFEDAKTVIGISYIHMYIDEFI